MYVSNYDTHIGNKAKRVFGFNFHSPEEVFLRCLRKLRRARCGHRNRRNLGGNSQKRPSGGWKEFPIHLSIINSC